MLTHDRVRKLHTTFQRVESLDKEVRFLCDMLDGQTAKVEGLGTKVRESIGRNAFSKLRDEDVGLYCVVGLVNALLVERAVLVEELDGCDVAPPPCPAQTHQHEVLT